MLFILMCLLIQLNLSADNFQFQWKNGRSLGAGSFASVYLGMDARSGRLLAIKQVKLSTCVEPDEKRNKDLLDAFEREVDLLKELDHDKIVRYLGSSRDDKHLNIVLEYVPGGSIHQLLGSFGKFEEELCKNFARQTLEGLEYLHGRGVIHRDIKGANILVSDVGMIKLTDFGISKKEETHFLGGGTSQIQGLHKKFYGTIFWTAPEVLNLAAPSSKADIWSVGCLVVEMLTGGHPYSGFNGIQAMYQASILVSSVLHCIRA